MPQRLRLDGFKWVPEHLNSMKISLKTLTKNIVVKDIFLKLIFKIF